MFRKTALAVILVMMFSFGSFSSTQSVGIEDTFETQGRQTLETNFTNLNQEINDFHDRWSLQGGLQAAIYHDGSLVYANSFGNSVSDINGQTPMQNHHRMRIASLSKAITGAAIQTLVVSGQISTSDKMVDLLPEEMIPTPLEGCEYPNHSSNIDDNGTPNNLSDDVQYGINDITVAHLLNMRAGFPKAPPETGAAERQTTSWHYEYDWVDTDSTFQGKNNPCIDDVTVAQEYNDGFDAPVKIETTIRETLRLPLSWQPGTWYNYSNLGYRILGEIIEAQSGIEYDEYVVEHVLEPMGIDNMQLARTLFEDQAQNEVTYYSRNSLTWHSYFPLNDESDGGEVDFGPNDAMPTPYGGSAPMEEMSASGGWISNAASYARFISYLDSTLHHPNFDDSLNFSVINPFGGVYANGISSITNNDQTWSHTGSLDGTSTRYERSLVNGESVVIVLMSNNRPEKSERINRASIGNISWWDDMANVMQTAFTIDYKNATPFNRVEENRSLVYDESSPCPPGTSQEGSGAHIILFGPPQMKCYYDSQFGKKGPDFDDEKGWQKCPEGTSTSGVGDPKFFLLNKDGGYIICYLDEELHPDQRPLPDEDERCPEGQELDENGRCVDEKVTDTPSVSVLATISMVMLAAFSQRRRLE